MADYSKDLIFDTRMRVRFPFVNPGVLREGESGDLTLVNGDSVLASKDVLPIKEWSIVDDVTTVSDVATFSIANIDGENTGRFQMGALVILEESHPQVANGQWITHFTGRVTATESSADIQGGSNITVTCMDLGWHLINCQAPAHVSIRGKRFVERSVDKDRKNRTLLEILIDKTWGFDLTKVTFDGNRMSRLRHGRQIPVQEQTLAELKVLPYIQVEIGQSPYEIMRLYAEREGLLINVDANGQLVFFRPDYKKQPLYELFHYPTKDPNSQKNNVIGRPSVRESIDGLYSKVTCWSTVVFNDATDPNDQNSAFTRTSTPSSTPNLVPFNRHHQIQDSEATSSDLRQKRAIMRYQLGQFESWEYSAEFPGHVQGPSGNKGFFTSNEMISIKDPINGAAGIYYVSMAQRSSTLSGGDRTRLVIKKAGLLDPTLGSLVTAEQKKKTGGGVKKPVTQPAAQTAGFTPVYDANGNQIGWK